ncbi:MAG: hypothetical protein ABII27_01785 [bacterium]
MLAILMLAAMSCALVYWLFPLVKTQTESGYDLSQKESGVTSNINENISGSVVNYLAEEKKDSSKELTGLIKNSEDKNQQSIPSVIDPEIRSTLATINKINNINKLNKIRLESEKNTKE